jgi:hypothetical protein
MPASGPASMIKPETIPIVFKRTALDRGTGPAMKIMRDKKVYEWNWT